MLRLVLLVGFLLITTVLNLRQSIPFRRFKILLLFGEGENCPKVQKQGQAAEDDDADGPGAIVISTIFPSLEHLDQSDEAHD